MSWGRPEFKEYATCTVCGMKKYCKTEGKMTICYACSKGNFKGLKRIKKAEPAVLLGAQEMARRAQGNL